MLIKRHIKILFVGDPAQLPPVLESDTPVFKKVRFRASLTEVVRHDSDILNIATEARNTILIPNYKISFKTYINSDTVYNR